MRPLLRQTKSVASSPTNKQEALILAVPSNSLQHVIAGVDCPKFYQINLDWLVGNSVARRRSEVEEDNDFVQLVGLFHVLHGDELLVYHRSQLLTEKRLRGKKSINFGGHVQPPDAGDNINPSDVILRELFDELDFCGETVCTEYLGCHYSNETDFSSRHVGICMRATPTTKRFRSKETHLQRSVHYEQIGCVNSCLTEYDDWSKAVLLRSGLV